MKRYPDCQMGGRGDCSACSLSSYGRDCHNNPVNQLAYLRGVAGLSQGDLSKATGINTQMISRIERGERLMKNTTLETCIKLADALGVTDLRELVRC